MQVNHTQATALIANVGHDVTFLLRGQPGVGKSAILTHITKLMPDYHVAYVDVTNLDLGDVGMPVVDREQMVTRYAPNARFGISPNQHKPVLLMLDELTKASKPVLNMLLPVILERRLGDVPLPAGSIVFATGNLDTDGVADNLPAHAANRMTTLDFRNPTSDEWVAWGTDNDIAPEVLAFAKQFPQVFDRYDEVTDSNPYIFNPLKGQVRSFCSPRSLAKASHLIKARAVLGDALLPALIGTVGESAARDLEAMTLLADQVPSFAAVTSNPEAARLPQGVGAYFLMAFLLAGRCSADTMAAVMTYVNRWESFEAKALFLSTVASNPNRVAFAVRNRAFTTACSEIGRFF